MSKLVALDLPGGKPFVSVLQRVWEQGDAVLPLDQRLPLKIRRELVSKMGASLVLSADSEQNFSGRSVKEGDALVVTTSGTGGNPKGVVLTHEAIAASAQMTSEALEVNQLFDRWLCCLPVSHIGGLSVIIRALITGTELEIHSQFDAGECENSGRSGASLVSLVATAMRRIDVSLFRKILVGGSSLPTGLPENVIATYGMTETGSGIIYDGFPLPNVQLRIRNGEILVKSPTLFRCYRNSEAPIDEDGWFQTGDGGALSADGKLSVFGRLNEVIVSGGEKIWPITVEEALQSLPWIHEAAVVGRPDDEWGEIVTAVLIVDDQINSLSLDELRDELGLLLPRYALPRSFELVDHLPKTASGKIRKKDL
jgi:O-succinylbenzoic acid--CoA ligase